MRKRANGVARSRREKEKVSADHTGTDTRASQSTHLLFTAPCTITHLTQMWSLFHREPHFPLSINETVWTLSFYFNTLPQAHGVTSSLFRSRIKLVLSNANLVKIS